SYNKFSSSEWLSAGDPPQRLNRVHNFFTGHCARHYERHELVVPIVKIVAEVQLPVVDECREIRDEYRDLVRNFHRAVIRPIAHRVLYFVGGPSEHPLCKLLGLFYPDTAVTEGTHVLVEKL